MNKLSISTDKSITPSTNSKPIDPEEKGGYIPDKTVKAEKRIEAFPFDTEAWSILIREAQAKKIEEARLTYERLVDQFPTAGKYWMIYIKHEVDPLIVDMYPICKNGAVLPRMESSHLYEDRGAFG